MEAIKRLPIGISDFKTLQRSQKYFVDKTMYLPLLEKISNFLFLIRPRRFGKSLFLSMVADYFDCANKDIEKEYQGTWIETHPLESKGKFQILQFDFSQVLDRVENLEVDFNTYCCSCLNQFVQKYQNYYTKDTVEWALAATTSKDKINILSKEAKERGYHLYLIIDEYDNFTNTVLNEQGEDVYWAITHAEGFYRDIFKKFKGTFDRIFITGVSPVTLDDVTSVFNIGWHISTKKEFNQMLGFSTEDVREMFSYYKEHGKIRPDSDIDTVISEMKPWYDNYCFSKEALNTQSRVFNCDMVLYYLRNYISRGEGPEEMIDPNTKTDYNKMKKLLRLDKLDGDRKGVIRTIAEKGEIIVNLKETFSARDITKPEVFPSLLFYYGMLTIKRTLGSQLVLGIPNNNVRKQYYTYLLEQY